MGGGGYYVFTISRCPDVPCQRRLVRRAGESITHPHRLKHHMTSSLVYSATRCLDPQIRLTRKFASRFFLCRNWYSFIA